MNTKTADARRQLIDNLSKQLKDKEFELAKFTRHSKAKRAIELRTEIEVLHKRIEQLKSRLIKATIIDNETGTVTEKSATDEAIDAFLRAKDRLLRTMGVPTTRRLIAAYVVGFALAAGVGYLMSHIISWAMIGAALLTGSELLVLLVYVIGMILAVFAGMRAFKAGFEYVADEKIDAHYNLVKAWAGMKWQQTKSLFEAKPVAVAAS